VVYYLCRTSFFELDPIASSGGFSGQSVLADGAAASTFSYIARIMAFHLLSFGPVINSKNMDIRAIFNLICDLNNSATILCV
jgi:hypothetical protein